MTNITSERLKTTKNKAYRRSLVIHKRIPSFSIIWTAYLVQRIVILRLIDKRRITHNNSINQELKTIQSNLITKTIKCSYKVKIHINTSPFDQKT